MRILIVSASAGAGHVRAAQALEEAALHLHPEATARHLDILEFTAKAYRKTYAGGYLKMIDRAPALWGAIYRATDHVRQRRVLDRCVQIFDKLEFAGFRQALRDFVPDHVLATHFLPCQVLAPYRAKGRDTFPLALVLTDFDAHALWVQPTADRFFVASEELREVLAGRGIDRACITVSGIPIMAAFAARHDRPALQRRLALDPALPTVLVTAGGAGVGAFAATVQAVLQCGPVQVLAVAGRNDKARHGLDQFAPPAGSALRVFGFVEQIAELMAVADVAVAKSGGLTTSECLAMGLPMLIHDPIPGQEERNADHVLEAGAGLKAHGLESLRWKLGGLVRDPARLLRMREAARAAGRPDAAATIVRALLPDPHQSDSLG
jgi:processive 1,2-diacylglycerol beta-glucosyltransferase